YVTLMALTSAVIFITIPLVAAQVSELRLELPKYIEGVAALIARWENYLREYFPIVLKYNFGANIARIAETGITGVLQNAPKYAKQFLTVCLLSPIFCYFMLKDGRSVSRAILSVFPNNVFEMAQSLSHKINVQLGDFIR